VECALSGSWGLSPEAYVFGAPALIAGRLSAEPWLALVGLVLGLALSRWLWVLLASAATGLAWGAVSYFSARADELSGPLPEWMYLAALPIVACALFSHGLRRMVRPTLQHGNGGSKEGPRSPEQSTSRELASPPSTNARSRHFERELGQLKTQRWLAMCLMVMFLSLVAGYLFESSINGPYGLWEWLTNDASPGAWALAGSAVGGAFAPVSGVRWRTWAIPSFFVAFPIGFVVERLSGQSRLAVDSFAEWLLPNQEYTALIWGLSGAVLGGLVTWHASRGPIAEGIARSPSFSSLVVLAAPILALATLSLPAPPERTSFESHSPDDYVVVGSWRFRDRAEEEDICENQTNVSDPQCQAYQRVQVEITRRYAQGLIGWIGDVAISVLVYLVPILALLAAFQFGLRIRDGAMPTADSY
jgi:hypothetical protein